MKNGNRFWRKWGGDLIVGILVVIVIAAIMWSACAAYDQCLEDGYNRTQCRMMVFNNNRSAVVVEGNR